ncbi:hypothetical protein [Streptomyces sp. Tu 3180]|nr:hypothetical protein [Streptomyces sp. Tu 3180]KAF3465449.1 hypothetical protein GL259_14620 [Streptomyces sp. Tu 3180]
MVASSVSWCRWEAGTACTRRQHAPRSALGARFAGTGTPATRTPKV